MKWIVTTISLLLLGCLLAACADVPTLSLTMNPTATPPTPAAILNIYSLEQTLSPVTLANFETQFQVKVNYITYAENETGLADIRAGLVNYDLVILNDLTVGALRPEGLFAPLTQENIPNFKNIDPAFVNPLFDPGNRYCAPYQWGTLGLGYNLETTGREVKGWADFFEASPPRRLGLPDDSRLSLGAVLLYLGYSPNTSNNLEIAEAAALLRHHSGQIITYAPTHGPSLLTDGQVDLLFSRSGAILQQRAADPAIHYAIPSEGSLMWVDSLCLLANAAHSTLAETFINYLLEPPVGAALTRMTRYSSANQAAWSLLNDTDRANPLLYPNDALRQRLFILVNLDPATSQLYDQTWSGLLADPGFQSN